MPELPEVETVKKGLQECIIGEEIAYVTVYYDRIIQNTTVTDFCKSFIGQKIVDVKRKGKYLIFIFQDVILVSHLRMEGKYFIRHQEEKAKHEHIIFGFISGKTLRYHDTRKFGTMELFLTTNLKEILKQKPLVNLGKEPLEPDFNGTYLHQKLLKSKRPLKSVLLDQTIVSGLGNIYANEVCFYAHLNPSQPVNTLTSEDFQNIAISAKKVIIKAISLGGTTIRTFVNAHEISGRFQNELMVHMRKKCCICGGEITKEFVGGRGTYYCKNCQKMR
ncbi:MAG: DNA-formamidopyrimidine glycosylase [Bacilli bacterium]|jgi:formamidopyrimidine-DNA glycosylase|nr:DNA-formamidopyrimidine glycosylase [Bacilli bacterium]MDD3348271.1 DNA-formamidopyrimidine glycosylase [Bacilli bacterium]MDD4056383.1 DNA-formamidopyrimidine glycosylase [Bacilli bacterium]MDY0209065.1 DNA-formamidopyrimidine glycosylase [Bacilli bacterium]